MTMFSWTWEEVERRVLLFNRVKEDEREKKIDRKDIVTGKSDQQ